jgi:hypothetical protein
MVAQRLDGNAIAKSIRERIGAEIVEKQKLNPRYKPCLKIIQGAFAACPMPRLQGQEATNTYERNSG